jgi:3-hydroxyisobutyrate dehydrogenase-like beta-hydroxyacid dehydrogenase
VSQPPSIAFIGFGEAGRAFAETLAPAGVRVTAYDVLCHGRDAGPLRAAADRLGVRLAASAEAAAAGADLVFSAVTAAQSLEAVRPLAGRLGAGQVLCDINSVSSGRKLETAALIRRGGAAYVDMAVMAAVHPHGHRTPVLLAGDLPEAEARLRALDFRYEIAGAEPGAAAAVKMVRSLFMKGLEAITVQALSAADAAGCRDRVQASLAASLPGLGWPGFAEYQIERVTTHGRRRAEEMREVATTMADLGFPEGRALALAIADLHDAVARTARSAPDVRDVGS